MRTHWESTTEPAPTAHTGPGVPRLQASSLVLRLCIYAIPLTARAACDLRSIPAVDRALVTKVQVGQLHREGGSSATGWGHTRGT